MVSGIRYRTYSLIYRTFLNGKFDDKVTVEDSEGDVTLPQHAIKNIQRFSTIRKLV